MSNQGQKVKKSIFDFEAKIGILVCSFILVKQVMLIHLKGIIGNHEIN